MSPESDVPTVMESLPGSDVFRLLPSSEESGFTDKHNIEFWIITKDSNIKKVFGTEKEKRKGLLIPRSKVVEIYNALLEGGNNTQGYSIIYYSKDKKGNSRFFEMRRTTGVPRFRISPIYNKDWILSKQLYVLMVPKLV